ncbi:reverse transcriptase [Gossypium australe]|uniref:Reverse transcriptase n=1 Tax=Gossypium australe TaxID=47621 RepID=A0A5B6WE72_9ROSI|nr:reverse transcriptase [Gossypium australe]
MALVAWDTICQPKTRGGFGIRHLNDQNFSFFIKIGFNLASKCDKLWVHILRAKYNWKDQIPESISRTQCSHFWRSLSKLWPLICKNLIWSIGDGAKVRCWKDPWIPGMGPLISKIPASSNLDLECCVREMYSSPHPDSGVDRVIWARSVSGIFSVRSAYWALKEETWHSQEEYWNLPWKYNGPQRVRMFLWLAFRQRLPTNSERTRRGISHSNSCTICGHDLEDLVHVLRDCPAAKDTANEVVKASSCWARQYESSRDFYKNTGQSSCSYNYSEDNWVHLFTDGAVCSNSGIAASGGVVRDHEGNWIMGFNRFLGVCSPFEVEIWGILDGIFILLNKGYRRISIVTDNLEVVQNLSAPNSRDSGIAVIRRTHRIIQSMGEWKIRHIPRSMNTVADHLAKMSLSRKTNLQVITQAPKEILTLLQNDKANCCFM